MTATTNTEIKTIALIDDHPLVFGALSSVFAYVLPDAELRSFVSLKGAAKAAADGWVPHLLILDLHLPDGTGPSNIRKMRALWPDAWIAIFSGMIDRPVVLQCVEEGACGFIPKTASPNEINEAIRTIVDGRVYLPRSIVSRTNATAAEPDAPPLSPDVRALTSKQIEVLNLLMRGQSNKTIARALGVAEGTVKAHVSAICQKLGVSTRVEAVVAATRLAHGPDAPPGLTDHH